MWSLLVSPGFVFLIQYLLLIIFFSKKKSFPHKKRICSSWHAFIWCMQIKFLVKSTKTLKTQQPHYLFQEKRAAICCRGHNPSHTVRELDHVRSSSVAVVPDGCPTSILRRVGLIGSIGGMSWLLSMSATTDMLGLIWNDSWTQSSPTLTHIWSRRKLCSSGGGTSGSRSSAVQSGPPLLYQRFHTCKWKIVEALIFNLRCALHLKFVH